MYLDFFGLTEKPFAAEIRPGYIILSKDQHEALATLVYAAEEQDGWALILGGPGLGKTTLISALMQELGEKARPAVITNPRLSALDFYNQLALELGMEGPYAGKGEFLRALSRLIARCRQENQFILVCVDEAQSLPPEMLEEIRLLGNEDDGSPRVLNIFFLGQLEFLRLMKRAGAKALMQRLRRYYVLKPLSLEETAAYVRHRLKVAGGSPDLFTPEAVEAVHRLSSGVPRAVNSTCEDALLLGFIKKAKSITANLVDEAKAKEPGLDWPPRPVSDVAPYRTLPQEETPPPLAIPAESLALGPEEPGPVVTMPQAKTPEPEPEPETEPEPDTLAETTPEAIPEAAAVPEAPALPEEETPPAPEAPAEPEPAPVAEAVVEAAPETVPEKTLDTVPDTVLEVSPPPAVEEPPPPEEPSPLEDVEDLPPPVDLRSPEPDAPVEPPREAFRLSPPPAETPAAPAAPPDPAEAPASPAAVAASETRRDLALDDLVPIPELDGIFPDQPQIQRQERPRPRRERAPGRVRGPLPSGDDGGEAVLMDKRQAAPRPRRALKRMAVLLVLLALLGGGYFAVQRYWEPLSHRLGLKKQELMAPWEEKETPAQAESRRKAEKKTGPEDWGPVIPHPSAPNSAKGESNG